MTTQTTPGRHDFSAHREKTRRDYYHGVRGARLRHAALAVLMAVGSCSMDEMWTSLKGRHRLDPSVTKKSVADALRYECHKGRAIRIGYGVYRIGDVSARKSAGRLHSPSSAANSVAATTGSITLIVVMPIARAGLRLTPRSSRNTQRPGATARRSQAR